MGVREWLKTKPASRHQADYDDYARWRNEARPDELPLIRSAGIIVALSLNWTLVLRVADYELDIDEAHALYHQQAHGRDFHPTPWSFRGGTMGTAA